ncbi:TPA: hypothetical protein ACN348_004208 [Vibrio parahaemolyticus]
MSNDKSDELNAANQKLSLLLNELQSLEKEWDEAVRHSAEYMGDDHRIEQFRDDRAMDALQRVNRVKAEIANQTQLVAELADKY